MKNDIIACKLIKKIGLILSLFLPAIAKKNAFSLVIISYWSENNSFFIHKLVVIFCLTIFYSKYDI